MGVVVAASVAAAILEGEATMGEGAVALEVTVAMVVVKHHRPRCGHETVSTASVPTGARTDLLSLDRRRSS